MKKIQKFEYSWEIIQYKDYFHFFNNLLKNVFFYMLFNILWTYPKKLEPNSFRHSFISNIKQLHIYRSSSLFFLLVHPCQSATSNHQHSCWSSSPLILLVHLCQHAVSNHLHSYWSSSPLILLVHLCERTSTVSKQMHSYWSNSLPCSYWSILPYVRVLHPSSCIPIGSAVSPWSLIGLATLNYPTIYS